MGAQEGIAATNAEFTAAFNAGDAAGIAALYTEDGWFMVQGLETWKGREAITAGFQGMLDSGVSRVELLTEEVHDYGDAAVEVGSYKLYAGDDFAGGGRFLVNWRNVNGRWQLVRDMINSAAP